MNKKLQSIIVVIFVLIFLSSCSKYALRGKVTDRATGLALEEVAINLKVEGEKDYPAKTNSAGGYRAPKSKNKLGILTAEKEGYESYQREKIGVETVLDFWLRPTVEETVKRVITLEKAGVSDEKKWEELYWLYLHIYYQAEYPLQTFLDKERAFETFYSILTDAEPVIKSVTTLTNWRDEHQHKVYDEVKKVVVELTTSIDGKESKIEKEFFLGVSDQYWHIFWLTN